MDPGWSSFGDEKGAVQNLGGRLGAWLADLLLSTFGFLAFVFPLLLVYGGWLIHGWRTDFRQFAMLSLLPRSTGFLLIILAGSGLAAMHFLGSGLPEHAGGVAGEAISIMLIDAMGFPAPPCCCWRCF